MDRELCELKHASVDDRVENAESRLDKHDEEIKALQLGQTATNTRMDNVCDKLDKLINAIYDVTKTIVGGVIVVGVGFIIWYIQKL